MRSGDAPSSDRLSSFSALSDYIKEQRDMQENQQHGKDLPTTVLSFSLLSNWGTWTAEMLKQRRPKLKVRTVRFDTHAARFVHLLNRCRAL